MSSIFEAYDEEFCTLTTDISSKINHATTYEDDATAKLNALKHVKALCSQGEDLVKQMEIEVRSESDEPTRRALTEKVTQYKKTLKDLKAKSETATSQAEREGLLGGAKEGSASAHHRQRLIDTNSLLEQQNDTLARARNAIDDTEEVALEITQELSRNRETIQSAHGKVREVGGMTNVARRLVHSMNKREVQQKIIVYAVALMILAALAVVIYLFTK